MISPLKDKHLLVLDALPGSFAEFYEVLGKLTSVHIYSTLDQLLAEAGTIPKPVILLDIPTLQASPTAHVAHLVERRQQYPMGLLTASHIEDYLFDLRRWGILQIAVKSAPIDTEELEYFIECVVDATSGFGLFRYLRNTVEMYNVSVSTLDDKNNAVERVINHFATAGFEIHELYDVRLILEETLNNALFHAFRTPTGEEKYSVYTFKCLEPGEKVRIEFGSNSHMAGFSVGDNAGSLPIKTIIAKLERQFNREGIFDESGRGLYLSRMLSSQFVMSVEAGKRSQVIALFDDRRRTDRAKPFMVNYIGKDTFPEWRMDPDFD